MAETSYPFTASTITQAQWQSMAKLFGPTGVAPNIGTELAVTASGSTMTVVVGIGQALVEGFFYNTDTTITLTISAANATNPRIDTIALRLNRTTNVVTAVVVAGTPAASPVQPTLNNTSALFDFPLADVLVGAAVGIIASGAVTDRRVTSGPRGTVVGTTDTQALTNKTLTSPTINAALAFSVASFSGGGAAATLTTRLFTALASATVYNAVTSGDHGVIIIHGFNGTNGRQTYVISFHSDSAAVTIGTIINSGSGVFSVSASGTQINVTATGAIASNFKVTVLSGGTGA